MNFIIVAPPYDENKGGALVLHKLCHLLNESGHTAFIFPFISKADNSFRSKIVTLKRFILRFFTKFRVNPSFNTPVIRYKNKIPKDSVVIYPEIVSGNPLNSRNIVRWFLHNPGYHTGKVCYGKDEFYISYKSFGHGNKYLDSYFAKTELTITHFFSDIYNTESALSNEFRSGSAYCLRKGYGRSIVHDLNDSLLIDGLNHTQIAEIFKRVKYFYSYDEYTAYSWFAILCGCIPIIIPLEGKKVDDWYPNKEDRFGIAYGVEDLPNAIKTKELFLNKFSLQEKDNIENVAKFVNELSLFLNKKYKQ